MKRLFLLIALLCASPLLAQDNWAYNFVTTGTRTPGITFANTSLTAFAISWDVSPPLLSCALQVDSSADGVSWGSGDLIATQNCAVVGSVAATSLAAGKNFVRINVTAFNGNGGVNVRLRGYAGAGGSSSSSPDFITKNGIDATATKYALKADAKYTAAATFTNGANTISCATNNDCNFTSADNGKICFGTNMTSDTSILAGNAVFPQGVLTVTGAQTATCSGGNWSTTTSSASVFVWGSDDTTALASAWTDAVAGCLPLYLPSGSMLVQSAQFNAASVNDVCVLDRGAGYGGYGVFGTGFATTRIIPTPNFSAASCTGGAGNACFLASPALTAMNFTIWGAGNANIGAGFNGKIGAVSTGGGAVTVSSNAYWYNVGLLSWGATTAGFTGLKINGQSNGTFVGVHNDGFGALGCDISNGTGANTINLYNVFCAVDLGPSLQINGSNVYSYGGVYGWTTNVALPAINITTGSTFWSYGDSAPFVTANTQSQLGSSSGGGTVYLNGSNFSNGTANAGAFALGLQNGLVIYARDSLIQTTTNGSTPIFICATCKFSSLGGNKITGGGASSLITVNAGGIYQSSPSDTFSGITITATQPTCAMTSGGGTGPACSTVVGSMNEEGTIHMTPGTTPGTTGTTTLTFIGSMSGPASAAPSCTFTYANSGTGAWSLTTTTPIVTTTRSTTAPVFNWNNGGALTAASTYDIDYVCVRK